MTQMFFQFLLCNFQDSAFFLSEEVFDELERVFVELVCSLFLRSSKDSRFYSSHIKLYRI